MSDGDLEAALYATGDQTGHRRRAEPDWATVHRELKRKHVTLQILWDEYIAAIPTVIAIRRFANSIAAGKVEVVADDAADPCGRRASCSSITPAIGFRSSSTG